MDTEAWRAAIHGVTKSRTRLSETSLRANILPTTNALLTFQIFDNLIDNETILNEF